jgi:hypothetical protein
MKPEKKKKKKKKRSQKSQEHRHAKRGKWCVDAQIAHAATCLMNQSCICCSFSRPSSALMVSLSSCDAGHVKKSHRMVDR